MGFTFDGKIKSYDVKLYNNAGNTLDVSEMVGLICFWTLHRHLMELQVESARCNGQSMNSNVIPLRRCHLAVFFKKLVR